MHIDPQSARYSHDFDIFHDAEEELKRASDSDVAALEEAGFVVEKRTWTAGFRQAGICRGTDRVDVDWAVDAAMRFYPIVEDVEMGWRLHPFDLATNKALALAARTVTRDVVDIVEWSRRVPLAAILWAACGKDPGYNPLMLLMMMRRFARVRVDELEALVARAIDPVELKSEWIELAVGAEEAIVGLADAQPDLPIGVVFARADGTPGWPEEVRKPLEEQGLRVHYPAVGGCWPRISGLD